MHSIEPSLLPFAVPIDTVHADPDNARRHDVANVDLIARSLAAFGQQKPIVVDAAGRCLAGNGTLAAARKLGWTHIAATLSSLTGMAARGYAIADNRTTDTSTWDRRRLAAALAAIGEEGAIGADAAGFSTDELDALVREAMDPDSPSEAGDEPEIVEFLDHWQVLTDCRDEQDQKALYERLTGEGYACRVITL